MASWWDAKSDPNCLSKHPSSLISIWHLRILWNKWINPFFLSFINRKATRQMVDAWLVSHSLPSGGAGTASNSAASPSSGSTDTDLSSPASGQQTSNNTGGKTGSATPVRKISAHEFERGGLLRPLISNVDGTLTFISPTPNEETHALINHNVKPFRRNRNELKSLDEKELIFELVKDICNDLDVRSLCHKILQVYKPSTIGNDDSK